MSSIPTRKQLLEFAEGVGFLWPDKVLVEVGPVGIMAGAAKGKGA